MPLVDTELKLVPGSAGAMPSLIFKHAHMSKRIAGAHHTRIAAKAINRYSIRRLQDEGQNAIPL